MYRGILFTIKNRSQADIIDCYDSIEYRFPALKCIKLPKGIGGFFLDRHRAELVLIGEENGILPEPKDQQVALINVSKKEIVEMWDGYEYRFVPGEALSLDVGIANQFVSKYAGRLLREDDLDEAGDGNPEVSVAEPAPVEEPTEPQVQLEPKPVKEPMKEPMKEPTKARRKAKK